MSCLVTLPNEFLNLLVEFICEGIGDVLLKWEWVVNCIDLYKVCLLYTSDAADER